MSVSETTPRTMTAGDLAGALRRKYVGKGWLLLEELRTRTGGARDLRVLDALAFNLWPSGKFVRIAFELKVSRSDFVAEIQNPQKRQPALDISHQFYFVTPVGLVKTDEVPEGCGLMEVTAKGKLRTVKVAMFRDQPPHLPVAFVATLLANLDPAFRNPQPASLWNGREVTAEEVEAEVEARCKVARANQESRYQRLREECDEHRRKSDVLRTVMDQVFGESHWLTDAELLAILGRKRPHLPYYCRQQIDRLDEVQRLLLQEWRELASRFTEEPSTAPTTNAALVSEVTSTVALANDPECAGRMETAREPEDCRHCPDVGSCDSDGRCTAESEIAENDDDGGEE